MALASVNISLYLQCWMSDCYCSNGTCLSPSSNTINNSQVYKSKVPMSYSVSCSKAPRKWGKSIITKG